MRVHPHREEFHPDDFLKGTLKFFTGILGGGKSILGVEEIFAHIEGGGWAFTTIEVVYNAWTEELARRGLQFEPERLVYLEGDNTTFHTRVHRGTADSQVLVVMDEAHLTHNSRDWAKTDRVLLEFITLVRKLDIHLVFITQDISNVDKQFRKMAVSIVHCRNLSDYRLFGVIPIPIPLLVRVHSFMGTGKPMKDRIEVLRVPKWCFPLYKSDAILGKNAEAFRRMRQVSAAPLKKIPRPKAYVEKLFWTRVETLITLCVTFSVLFS